ncbi:MAG: glycoside hydrolase family 13 protein, partial [Planctomycetota bacterium]
WSEREFQINKDSVTGLRESITKWSHSANDGWHQTSNYGAVKFSEMGSDNESRKRDQNKLVSHALSSVANEFVGNETADGRVPGWARDAVFYQIFPERFRNGDPSNDPTHESLEFPEVVPSTWTVTPWTSQWYRRADWEKQMGSDFYEDGVFHRRYGGDLQGVIDKLDYLNDLGINAIYFNPVFYAKSLHKYDGNSFHHIDPHFGPDPQGDFKLMATETADPKTWKWTAADRLFLKLIEKAKQRKIRVIIDGVFNHTGRNFFAFEDLAKRQEQSPYKHWYIVENFDDPKTDVNEFKYKGWWGVDTLPEFANNSLGNDLHPDPKKYIFTATRRWMDPNGDGNPNDGIDGWRLDVANEVPNKFWVDWNRHVREINPEAYTVSEIWDNASKYLSECGFSATMNYHGFAFPAKGFLIDGRLKASEFAKLIEQRMCEHEPAVRFALQNLFDSHDTDRLASMIVNAKHRHSYKNASRFDYDVGERVSPRSFDRYDVSQPSAADEKLVRLATLFQMTFVGAPMVYYGTEAGMDGADDPDDRMPMTWQDLDFETRTYGPKGPLNEAYEIGFDEELFQYYQQLIELRIATDTLRRGEFEVLHVDDAKKLLVYSRKLKDDLLLVALNRGDGMAAFTIRDCALDDEVVKVANVFSTETESIESGQRTLPAQHQFRLAPCSGQVWRVTK